LKLKPTRLIDSRVPRNLERWKMSEDFPDWFHRRKRRPFFRDWFFEDFDRMFHEMQKMMEEDLKVFTSRLPKDYLRERKLPDGRTVREWGPFVYGYSVKIGPDGKPEISEFGNVKQSRFGPKVKEERDPLVDVIETDGEIHVVAELPGVEKEEIKLHATESTLTISVESPKRKYFKEVTLLKAAKEKGPQGEPINID